ncbi:MAG: cytochrome c3 family protein, partial [Planctomycetota bacterium]
KLDQSRWAAPQAVKGVPEMCFDCHDTYADRQYYVHGPVAVGQCDVCHDPHESDHDALLTDSVPSLCYNCHDKSSIESIASHEDETVDECNTCHETHVSSKEKLIK